MSPCREESELKRVLSELCRGDIFDDAAVHQHYLMLASLIGAWLSERVRLETSPVKNALLTMAKNLSEASALLSGLETGVRSDIEIAVASRVQNLMALDPTIVRWIPRGLCSVRSSDTPTASHTLAWLPQPIYQVVPKSAVGKQRIGTILF
jgi:hypothetical protein